MLARWVLGGLALAAGGGALPAGGCGGSEAAAPGAVEPGVVGARVRLMMVKEPDGSKSAVSGRLSAVLGPWAAKGEGAGGPGDAGGEAGAWKATRERLRRAGIRAVVVPREELAGIESALDTQPAGSEVSLGQSSRWTVVATGGELSEGTAVRVQDGLMGLSGGKLRLLLRCFVAPWGRAADGSVSAGLRVDVAPQHEAGFGAGRERRSEFAAALEAPKLRTVEDAGQVFTSLALEAFIGPGEVLLLVPESPEVRWAGTKVEGGEAKGETPGGEGDLGPTPMEGPLPEPRVVFSGVGPRPPRPKTVGELILTDATDISDAGRRMIVVVDPILPGRYQLLPEGR